MIKRRLQKRKVGIAALVIVLLFLDFLALDDITTGNETSFLKEYAVLGVSIIIFGLIGYATLRRN